MEEKFEHNGVAFDLRDGLGAVYDVLNVDYKGFLVFMRPSVFLALTPEIFGGNHFVREKIEKGGPIGPAFLSINPEDETRTVRGHEGRNRMQAILEKHGDLPMPVAFLLDYGFRSRDITGDQVRSLCAGMIREKSNGEKVDGPLFERAILCGEDVDLSVSPAFTV